MHFACVRFSQLPPDVGFQSLFLGHCAANVAALGGGVNRNACVRFECVHFVLLGTCDQGAANGAANVAALGGRSEPERLAE